MEQNNRHDPILINETSIKQKEKLPQNEQPLITNTTAEMSYPKITLSRSLRWLIFCIFATITVSSSLDGGIIPAKTSDLIKDLNINNTLFGLFGSIDYFGRLFGSLVFTGIINKTNRKYLFIFTILLKAFTLMITYYTQDYIVLCIFRGISGFSQVFFTIYIPVWCDQYGPKKYRTMMITINQVGLPLGIVLGFGLAMIISTWIWSFVVEGLILFCFAIIVMLFPKLYFSNTLVLIKDSNTEASEEPQEIPIEEDKVYEKEQEKNDKEKDSVEENNKEEDKKSKDPSSLFKEIDPNKRLKSKTSIWKSLASMLCEMVFLFTGLSNSVVFFTMAVIQFWAPEYMEKVLGEQSEYKRFIMFGIVCISAPILGILAGGILGSCVGGYTQKKTIFICIGLSIFSIAAGLFVPECTIVWTFAISLWAFFFFSTAMIPIETGIIISSLPPKLRGDGFSVMNFLLNLVGNLPSSYVYGALYDYFKDNDKTQAMRIIMYYNFVGLISIIIATIFRVRKPKDTELTEVDSIKIVSHGPSDQEVSKFGKNMAQVYGGYGNPDILSPLEGRSENSDNTNPTENNVIG